VRADPELERVVRSWLQEEGHEDAERVLFTVLDQVDTTPQRRAGWLPQAFPIMNNRAVRYGMAAAAVVLVALAAWSYLPTSNMGDPGPLASPSPTATPMTLPGEDTNLEPGTYRTTPFAPGLFGVCEGQAGCTESSADDSIAFTVTVPDGWSVSGLGGIWVDSNAPPDGAMLIFWRGGWLYEDPCDAVGAPTVEVGPTVDDFAEALADHPLLDVTTPVDVTLAGYSGKYVDVMAPANLDECASDYRLWDPGIYAQGPEHRWHLWILDFEGTRVVVQTMDFPGTPDDRRAELQAMLDSLEITP
jgi:hypothetical protein